MDLNLSGRKFWTGDYAVSWRKRHRAGNESPTNSYKPARFRYSIYSPGPAFRFGSDEQHCTALSTLSGVAFGQ